MNQIETEKLLTIIQKTYKTFFKEFDPDALEINTVYWQRSLAEYSWGEVMTAYEHWLNTEDKPPSLARFKSFVAKQRSPHAFISPERAWERVDSAVRRFGSYNQDKAFSTFSEPITRAVRSIGGWQKICATELGRDWDYLRRNFIEAYSDFEQDVKEQELLPPSVLKRLNKAIEEANQERLGQSE